MPSAEYLDKTFSGGIMAGPKHMAEKEELENQEYIGKIFSHGLAYGPRIRDGVYQNDEPLSQEYLDDAVKDSLGYGQQIRQGMYLGPVTGKRSETQKQIDIENKKQYDEYYKD